MYCNHVNIKFSYGTNSDIFEFLCYDSYTYNYMKVFGTMLWNFDSHPSKNIYIRTNPSKNIYIRTKYFNL